MKRVPTGVDELDVKLSGGYPNGKGLLVTGVSDAGKTVFRPSPAPHVLRGRYELCADRNRRDT